MKKIILKYLNLSSGKQFSFIIFLSLIGLAIEILFKEIAIAQFLKVTRIPILVLGSLSSTLMIFRIFKKSKVDLKKKIEIKKKEFSLILESIIILFLIPVSFILIYFACSGLIGIFLGVWDFNYVYLVHFNGKISHSILIALFSAGGIIIFFNTVQMIITLVKKLNDKYL